MGNISDLPDDLLVKILSCLPTKAAAAMSVLSKRWCCVWKQWGHHYVEYAELCYNCSIRIPRHLISASKPRGTTRTVFDEECGCHRWVKDPPPPLEKFDSLMSRIKADASCIECREKIRAHKKVTIIFLNLGGAPKSLVVIWTKLEDIQQMHVESVIRRKTLCNCCFPLT